MGARFYGPTVGRWLSEDPVQDEYFNPLTLNFYAYVLNNPVLLTDPEGTRVVEFEPGYEAPTSGSVQDAATDWGGNSDAGVKEAFGAIKEAFGKSLNPVGTISAVVGAAAAGASIAIVARLPMDPTARAVTARVISYTIYATSISTIVVAYAQARIGQISSRAAAWTIGAAAATTFIPPLSASSIAQIAKKPAAAFSGTQGAKALGQALGWAAARAIGLVNWIFPSAVDP